MDKKNVYYAQTYKADTLLVPLKNKRRIRAFNGYITDGVDIFRGRNQKINLDAKTFGILGDDYLYDKKGVYKSHDVSEKIPFDYKVPVRLGKNLSYLNGNVFYNNQVYDYWEDKVYTLTQEQIEEVNKKYLLAGEKNNVDELMSLQEELDNLDNKILEKSSITFSRPFV